MNGYFTGDVLMSYADSILHTFEVFLWDKVLVLPGSYNYYCIPNGKAEVTL